MAKKIIMIAYTDYSWDARIKREAGTLAGTSEFEVRLLCLKEQEKKRSYVADGVVVDELNLAKYSGNNPIQYLFSYIRFLLRAFLVCTWACLLRGVDIVHVHNMPNCLVFSAIVPWALGKRVILDVHDCMPEIFSEKFKGRNGFLHKLLCLEESMSCAFAARVICVNHVQRDLLVGRGIPEEKVFVSMNVPDHRKFLRVDPASRNGHAPGRFRIAYHGTIARRLGVDLAIRAVAELKEKLPAIEFHLWGGGEYLQECRSLARQLGVEDKIRFNGTVEVEELTKAVGQMDLGIVPNRKSTATEVMLPVKMLEYICMGIPVLAPKITTIRYYFSDEMVGYFEPDNLESLKEAILRVYEDCLRGKVMAEKAQRFLDQYGWEKQSIDFVNFYHSIEGA